MEMPVPRAVIFDLGGTLIDWPDWDERRLRCWASAHAYVTSVDPGGTWPAREELVAAMAAAEAEHWRRVDDEQRSGPPTTLVQDGLRRLGRHPDERALVGVLDGYARSVAGWAVVFPDVRATLGILRARGYRLGLLSNTWWAADWHNADLAAHGLDAFLDEIAYTSDLAHSKPHPSVFRDLAARLGVTQAECVMVGDRAIDDVAGALRAGMRAVWKENSPLSTPPSGILPTATIANLAEVPSLLREWGGR